MFKRCRSRGISRSSGGLSSPLSDSELISSDSEAYGQYRLRGYHYQMLHPHMSSQTHSKLNYNRCRSLLLCAPSFVCIQILDSGSVRLPSVTRHTFSREFKNPRADPEKIQNMVTLKGRLTVIKVHIFKNHFSNGFKGTLFTEINGLDDGGKPCHKHFKELIPCIKNPV